MTSSTGTGARTARSRAAVDAKRTAQSTSEAVRETVNEVAEDTRSLMTRVGERTQFLAVRTAQEVDRVRRAAKPFVRPVLYTAGMVVEPVGTLGVAAVDMGARVIRNRVNALAHETPEQLDS